MVCLWLIGFSPACGGKARLQPAFPEGAVYLSAGNYSKKAGSRRGADRHLYHLVTLADGIHHLLTVDDLTENGMFAIQVWLG